MFGKVVTPIKVKARRPGILWTDAWLGLAIEKSGKLPKRLHTIVQLRVAQMIECPFWTDIGSAVGRKQNDVTDEEIRAVSQFRESSLFSESELAALEYAEEMTKTPVAVPSEIFEKLKRHFSDEQIVELTASVAYENYRARFNHALDIKSDNLYD